MKTRFLFPYNFKFIGLFIIVLAHLPITHFLKQHDLVNTNPAGLFTPAHIFFISNLLMIVIGLLMIAFSKEKIEDEQISQLRLDSLQWAIYVNYTVLVLSLIFTNGIDAVDVLKLNLWVPLIFFIVRFRWALYRLNSSLT
jgi:hypothetical protein